MNVEEAIRYSNWLEEIRRAIGEKHRDNAVLYQVQLHILAEMKASISDAGEDADHPFAGAHRLWCSKCGRGRNPHVAADLQATLAQAREAGL
jgi:hypothetical protein